MTHFVSFRLLAGIFGEFIETAFFERWGSFWQKKSYFEQRSVFKDFPSYSEKVLDFRQKRLARIPNFCSISPEEHFF